MMSADLTELDEQEPTPLRFVIKSSTKRVYLWCTAQGMFKLLAVTIILLFCILFLKLKMYSAVIVDIRSMIASTSL